MKKAHIFIFCIFFSLQNHAQTPHWEWVTQVEGYYIHSLLVGNPEPDGSFYGIANFDTTMSIHPYYFNTPGFGPWNGDIAFVKFDSTGTPLWGRQYGGSKREYGYHFDRKTNGNEYFRMGVASTDFYINGDTLPSGSYFCEYNPRDGGITRLQKLPTSSFGQFNSNKDLFVNGSFYDTLIIGLDTIIGPPGNLGWPGILPGNYIARYDSAFQPIWAKNMLTQHSLYFLLATSNTQADFYLFGYHQMDTTAITPTDTLFGVGNFLVKMNDQAEVLWIRNFRHIYATVGSWPSEFKFHQVEFDTNNNLYVLGGMSNGGFETTDTTIFHDKISSYWLAKYDPNGNMQWLRSMKGDTLFASWPNLTVSPDGDRVYVTGGLIGEVTFGTYKIRRDSVVDIFVAAYDGDGNELWIKSSDTPLNPRRGYYQGGLGQLVISPKGNLLFPGYAYVDGFKLGSTTFHGQSSLFIASLSVEGNPLGTISDGPEIALQLYPNPVTDQLHLSFTLSNPAELAVTLFDLSGRKVGHENFGLKLGGVGQESHSCRHLPAGVYVVEVQVGERVFRKKVCKW